jgi:hypothetical protein
VHGGCVTTAAAETGIVETIAELIIQESTMVVVTVEAGVAGIVAVSTEESIELKVSLALT